MLTMELQRAFWARMMQEFGASVEQKNDSELMKAAAVLLDGLDIQDRQLFMESFVTTIHKTIYIPFVIGVEGPDGRWPQWAQARVCAHECQHVVQGEREGWLAFDTRYLTSSSFRAGSEAEAYGCDMEMEFWRTGRIMNYAERAQTLKTGYGCSAADVEQAIAMLAIRAEVVRLGGIESLSAQAAISWLEIQAPGLRETC